MDDSEGDARAGSPAASVADDPMQHAGCDEPPILRSGAAVVASANPGCAMHLAAAGLVVRHPFELIDEAIDGR